MINKAFVKLIQTPRKLKKITGYLFVLVGLFDCSVLCMTENMPQRELMGKAKEYAIFINNLQPQDYTLENVKLVNQIATDLYNYIPSAMRDYYWADCEPAGDWVDVVDSYGIKHKIGGYSVGRIGTKITLCKQYLFFATGPFFKKDGEAQKDDITSFSSKVEKFEKCMPYFG